MKSRPIYGVIAAQIADIEQREILLGIIETAQKLNIDIAVISNIYNPNETSDVLKTENQIYNLISSDEFDGFILISESIINEDLQKLIIENLSKRKSVPVIAVGTPLPDFVMPDFHFINTSDEQDIEDITDHLIDVHGFTDIHILTGHDFIDASHKRVQGYKASLQKHGMSFSKDKVFFGDFWYNSGNKQAEKYIKNELLYPQAVICCNDYMAYGMLDTFMEHDIEIPKNLTIVGYEYVGDRRNHTPMLTTFQRNRKELGKQTVNLLTQKLKTGEYGNFAVPKGRFICGDTCYCGTRNNDIKREINEAKTKATYDFLDFFSQFEYRLNECRNIDEFVTRCHDFQFMIRNVNKLYMCLYDNWYNNEPNTENMVGYNLLTHEKPIFFNKNHFSCLFRESAAPYYFSPLFLGDRELGIVVLRFDSPDTYDHIFRNWLKSLSNSLEFLRMKNDIKFLIQCQNISEQRDTLTSMLNEKGFENAFESANKDDLYIIGFQICLFKDLSFIKETEKINAITDAAKCLLEFCGNNDICARIENNICVCILNCKASAEILKNRLSSFLYQHKIYMNLYDMDSFVCCALPCNTTFYSETMSDFKEYLAQKIKAISDRRIIKHYSTLINLRTHIYKNPEDTFDMENIYSLFDGSVGHLRLIYKKCFGISLLQDCISARMAKAKYLLMTTSMNYADIAEACGYSDNKYFMRQFSAETGITASRYKTI